MLCLLRALSYGAINEAYLNILEPLEVQTHQGVGICTILMQSNFCIQLISRPHHRYYYLV
jgi:hypothetical protein